MTEWTSERIDEWKQRMAALTSVVIAQKIMVIFFSEDDDFRSWITVGDYSYRLDESNKLTTDLEVR